jgi:hypothetical protein
MDKQAVNLYLSRILSGFYIFSFQGRRYKLVYPNMELKYKSELYAAECYEQQKFNDWIYEDNIVDYLVDAGLWNYGGDDQLKKIETQIEDNKVELYQNFLNPPKQKQVRKTLASLKKNYNRMYNVRHSLDSLTPHGYAELLKNQYILIHSLYNLNNTRIFKSTKNTDYNKLNEISNILAEYTVDIGTFRKIARNDLWKNYWSANKHNIFDKATIDWTDEQRTLVVLTKMYDSAYEHPECPVDSVFDDDDMFDGWMIHQRREGEKIRSKNRTEKLLEDKNLSKANEVYIMASSKEEAHSIYNLNDNTGMHIIKERSQMLVPGKEIKESDLPDVQRSLQMMQNQQLVDSRKG